MQLVMKSVFGSHLYGTSTPESDMDYKGIFIPPARELVLGTVKDHYSNNTSGSETKNTKDDIDEEMFSLKYFIDMAKKGETIALDMIHTPRDQIVELGAGAIWDVIRQNRHRFYTTDMKAYLGYVRKQAAKYGVKGSRLAALRQVLEHVEKLPSEVYKTEEEMNKEARAMHEAGILRRISIKKDTRILNYLPTLPMLEGYTSRFQDEQGNVFYEVLGRKFQNTMRISEFKQKLNRIWNEYGERARKAEANEGIDWKALHHACRAGFQLQEIYTKGDLQYPLKNCDYLMQIKQGLLPFKEVQEYLENLVDNVERHAANAAKNGMRQSVDTEFWDDFVYKVYLEEIMQGAK